MESNLFFLKYIINISFYPCQSQPSLLPSDQPSDQPSSIPSNEEERGILICKIDEDGNPISPSSPLFTSAVADPEYSSKDYIRAIIESETGKGVGESFPEYIAKVYKWLSVWSQVLPSGKISNFNFVEGEMKVISDDALAYLGELKKFHEKTFRYPSDDQIGPFFEGETRDLGKIRAAFQDYVGATMAEYDSSSKTQPSLIKQYTEKFR